MKIHRLKVAGYKSLKSVVWEPGDLNVLIGPNGSGKTNLLRLLEMLSVSARGKLSKYIQREGGMGPVVWDGRAEAVKLNLLTELTESESFSGESETVQYSVELARLGDTSRFVVGAEEIANWQRKEGEGYVPVDQVDLSTIVQEELRQYAADAAKRGLARDLFELGKTDPLESNMEQRVRSEREPKKQDITADELPEDETSLCMGRQLLGEYPSLYRFATYLSRWMIHHDFRTDADSEIRKPAVTRHERGLQSSGENLINFLHTLYTGNRQFENELNRAMAAAFDDDFEELSFQPAADQLIQMRIRWRNLTWDQPPSALSDGTLRFLFVVAALLDPDPPPLIAIEEPDTSLHPSMFPIIAGLAAAASKRTQVVLTTHSPAFLDAFDEVTPTTTVMEWDDGETKLRTLSGESLEYWLSKYKLGELFRTGGLEAIE